MIKQFLLPGSWGAALAARKPEPQGPGPKFADRLSVHTSPSESAIDNLEHCVLIRIRRRGSDGFELAIGLSVLAFNIQRTGPVLREKERKRIGGGASTDAPEIREGRGNVVPRNQLRCPSKNTLEDLPNRSGQLMACPESTASLPAAN